MGLADHTIEPEVAEPVADCVAPPADDCVALLPADDEELLLLQPATPSAPTTPTRAVSCQPFRGRLPGWLIDLARIMRPPL